MSESILNFADTNIQSEEEGLTALHFSARYTPRIVDLLVQQQESEEGGSSERQDSKLTSARAMLYLVSLKGSNKVKVCHSSHMMADDNS